MNISGDRDKRMRDSKTDGKGKMSFPGEDRSSETGGYDQPYAIDNHDYEEIAYFKGPPVSRVSGMGEQKDGDYIYSGEGGGGGPFVKTGGSGDDGYLHTDVYGSHAGGATTGGEENEESALLGREEEENGYCLADAIEMSQKVTATAHVHAECSPTTSQDDDSYCFTDALDVDAEETGARSVVRGKDYYITPSTKESDKLDIGITDYLVPIRSDRNLYVDVLPTTQATEPEVNEMDDHHLQDDDGYTILPDKDRKSDYAVIGEFSPEEELDVSDNDEHYIPHVENKKDGPSGLEDDDEGYIPSIDTMADGRTGMTAAAGARMTSVRSNEDEEEDCYILPADGQQEDSDEQDEHTPPLSPLPSLPTDASKPLLSHTWPVAPTSPSGSTEQSRVSLPELEEQQHAGSPDSDEYSDARILSLDPTTS